MTDENLFELARQAIRGDLTNDDVTRALSLMVVVTRNLEDGVKHYNAAGQLLGSAAEVLKCMRDEGNVARATSPPTLRLKLAAVRTVVARHITDRILEAFRNGPDPRNGHEAVGRIATAFTEALKELTDRIDDNTADFQERRNLNWYMNRIELDRDDLYRTVTRFIERSGDPSAPVLLQAMAVIKGETVV